MNVGPLAAEIVSLVWGTPANLNWFRVLAALLHSQTAALNRGRHLSCTAGRPSCWALAHISSCDLLFQQYDCPLMESCIARYSSGISPAELFTTKYCTDHDKYGLGCGWTYCHQLQHCMVYDCDTEVFNDAWFCCWSM